MVNNWKGKRIVIIGAARQGQAAARFLFQNGAIVTLNDQRSSNDLRVTQATLKDIPINWVLGSHPLELLDGIDFLCLSGGIPLTLPIIVEAIKRGIPLINDTQVFMQVVPCRTIGITGSAGKTTTTSIVGQIAHNAFSGSQNHVWVGGNIGDPLLNHINKMQPDDLAILEISSFQLEQMTLSPDIAAILNITPNHLDRHITMQAYTTAKSRLLEFQDQNTFTILGRDDPFAWNLKDKVHGKLLSFGFSKMDDKSLGMTVSNGKYILRNTSGEKVLFDQSIVHLRGEHNQLNVMAACLIAIAAGLQEEAVVTGIQEFRGVAHRLEYVRSWGGVDWYNDSIATAPERSMAAIRSFEQPIVLMLGGRDKDLPWESLAELIQERVRQVVLFGEAAEIIEHALSQIPENLRHYSIQRCKGLKEAVFCVASLAKPGDVVLLSPGGTSFDEFRDFEERGERFHQWVQELS
ncbi:MAG: UDP-N-acetylmuramoylalanine--D-glutamate ligase [Chloroflexi bacterium GWB2_49_20]|nr:MAG: UDP-N-acetylmuramoylalanine--D-glutamate ligase [Chloroflexi bacterium GWB2_49_20]OGN76130.1 MAG: UDP-N-acetylmuramoylalanine--D-glutamate ligase [Chloroflexi bacterium GWC2_49_37]OGN83516.1 MAG: UDP-N-acetylmuramoylalanine--D-glutamate ligase [Chloroflexi bacterium GWD2_49_16]HBG73917.1 UDP-N-acetylmuramoyl-L-alanine--D-glutamate ligase [Anaerolineae bacterium]HCC79503.1 UDP-N-acetylmuramoyl-L-alanine--D-glutamate ligase [Anaerolineae bacterium]